MALALRGPQFCTDETNRHDFALAKDLDLPVTVHVGYGEWGKQGPIRVLERDGLLSDTTTYVHCNTLGDDELDIIRDSGGTVAVAPDVEMQMGHGWPATGRLLAHGIRPTFAIDVCSSNGGDMFATMRTAIGVQRALDNSAAVEAMENGRPTQDLLPGCPRVRDARRRARRGPRGRDGLADAGQGGGPDRPARRLARAQPGQQPGGIGRLWCPPGPGRGRDGRGRLAEAPRAARGRRSAPGPAARCTSRATTCSPRSARVRSVATGCRARRRRLRTERAAPSGILAAR